MLIIVIFGALLRFYNLGWGSPYFFHPDERNIAGSISRMYWDKTLNPHFFAYGSFWNYIVLFFVKITGFQWMGNAGLSTDPFSRAIQILRVLSALQGTGLIVLSYFITKQFTKALTTVNLLLPFLIATSPGLIQASHFGTFEQSLAFLYALIFYLLLKFLQTKKIVIWFAVCIIFGISVSIRVTSMILLPIFISCLIFTRKKSLISPISFIYLISFFLIPTVIFYFFNPYSFDFSKFQIINYKLWNIFSSDFIGAMHYESDVALGTLPVFYTQQFQQTIPVIYQFFKVLPFILNPVIWILFPLALIYSFYQIIHKSLGSKFYALNSIFFLSTFLPNSLLFVKWTRYVIPSLPFVYIFVFLFLIKFSKSLILYFLSFICIVFALFFISVYSTDTRIAAAIWAKENFKPDVKILSEVYDMGIVPFNDEFPYYNIKLFNFYELDDKFNDTENLLELKNLLSHTDVIVLPSHRLIDTRLRLPSNYPNANWFYKSLFEEKLGFKLVKTFSHPYDKILPGITPDESFTVFDHPDFYIFIKI